jgi:fumarate hydratase subunit beta
VYLAATGGAGALIARCVQDCTVIAFPELGPEAIFRLIVKDLPLITAADTLGNDLYAAGPAKYRL